MNNFFWRESRVRQIKSLRGFCEGVCPSYYIITFIFGTNFFFLTKITDVEKRKLL